MGAVEIKQYHPAQCFRCAASDVDPQNVHRNKCYSILRCAACVTLLYNNPIRYSPETWGISLSLFVLTILNKGSLDFRKFFEKVQLLFYLHKVC